LSIPSIIDKELVSVARRSRSTASFAQVALLALCATTGLVFAAWVLGLNGLGLVSGAELPSQLTMSDSNGAPSEVVLVQGEEGLATVVAGNRIIHDAQKGPIQPGSGWTEFYGNEAFLSFEASTDSQHVAWFAVRALPSLGLAVIWWLLFRVVRDVGQGGGFSIVVARRLRLIGLLVLVGMPVLQLGRQAVAEWLVESSNAARIADVPPLHLDVWPFAVGLVILVMASAWREVAGMREDLDGLV
jgi:hypothetical protein